MKTLIFTALSTVALVASDITVEIKNILNSSGKVQLGLYNSSDGFLKTSKVYKGVTIKASENTLKYRFQNIPDGVYAISVFHDENSNGKIDRNLIGIPSEGYGVSNNVRPVMGPPVFDEAKFVLSGDKSLVIEMGY